MNKAKVTAVRYSIPMDIGILVKFKLSLMVVMSSALSYLILAKDRFVLFDFCLLLVGGLLVTFAANALNQSIEREYDKMMSRTANRPVAAGRMSLSNAVLLAGIFCTLGILALSLISLPAAVLGMLSFVLYAFVYTPLKRYSPIAIPVGAIPGALPTLIAGVIACNGFTVEGIALFGLQYLWQFPHFWSIAWLGHQDYMKAGFRLIRDVDGKPDPMYGVYSALYAGLSLIVLWMMHWANPLHSIVLFSVGCCILIYVFFGVNLYLKNNSIAARQLMFISFFYLPVLFFLFYLNNVVV